ncbi:MAG TPA: AAA family ATPase [Allosphingosinicella sp.]|nr:AAA family ATPase [Allosphingosinicella sp.]
MATANQILSLLSSHVRGDDEQMYATALQVAAEEARRGREQVAQRIRKLIEEAREGKTTARVVSLAQPRGDLHGVLEQTTPKLRLSDVVLAEPTRLRLETILREQKNREQLRHHGRKPSAKLLLVGPPGSGKTMTAGALAFELKLPLLTIRLENLITRFLGETASKMRLIFDEIGRRRAVYLFDEFDALGSKRSTSNDVGEMRRILNSFLQFVEEENSTDSLVVSTTNNPGLLDTALLRRFDDVIPYDRPTDAQIKKVIVAHLPPAKLTTPSWKRICEAARGLSQAELARAVDDVVKGAILTDKQTIPAIDLIIALERRRVMGETMGAYYE